MNEAADFAVSAVILSERSLPAVAGESKDLYLTQHARLPNESGSCVLASLPCSCPTMSDPPISAVILSERSESKDLYVPRAERLPTEVAHREGGGSDGSTKTRATV